MTDLPAQVTIIHVYVHILKQFVHGLDLFSDIFLLWQISFQNLVPFKSAFGFYIITS